jgi:hypothetical protein
MLSVLSKALIERPFVNLSSYLQERKSVYNEIKGNEISPQTVMVTRAGPRLIRKPSVSDHLGQLDMSLAFCRPHLIVADLNEVLLRQCGIFFGALPSWTRTSKVGDGQ